MKLNLKTMSFPKWLVDLNHRHLYIILPPIFLFVFFSFSSVTTTLTNPFSNIPNIQLIFPLPNPPITPLNHDMSELNRLKKQKELNRSRIAVCLVGGARRFELTGPSILENVVNLYPNTDLFLHSPFDKDSYKFSFLKVAKRLVSIQIFKPKPMMETESQVRVLTSANSPNGIQGLLQYFNLVEGCLTMIKSHQTRNNFTYDWIVRTRVDGYWNAPLKPEDFMPGYYVIPAGSNYGGLNDRLGIGDLNTSTIALSRLSLIPELDSYGLTKLNSETAFKAQLTTQHVKYRANRLPFCIVTDRKYLFPPDPFGVPVASMSSLGPLSGTKCRPCKPICRGSCVGKVMERLYKWHGWTNWENGTLELCDAHDDWDSGWEKMFDRVAGKKFAAVRKRTKKLSLSQCVKDFEVMKQRSTNWDSPPLDEICRLGLWPKSDLAESP